MAKIIVDDNEYDIADGNNLLHACLSVGLDLPYFCWHPCMGSVGACRQCAVKQYQDENDERGRIVMACMTPVSEGMRLSINDPQATDFRAGIIELLMTNHPHDCPVCEEGGECHLQDMTEMSGHTFRRYDQTKRTYRNQYLGPFINHEMNRCITCYRCVRYYQDYAGGDDLQMLGSRDQIYFGRHCDGTLENPFSGNLVEVCPTGVFTDKTFSEHFTRKWDLQCAPSVCQHCAVGCNTSPGERYGTLKRITNRYHSAINGYFLCDRGRFGYGFVNSKKRIRQVLRRDPKTQNSEPLNKQPLSGSVQEAVATLTQALGDPKTIAIGSPRASLESNFALLHAVGKERFYAGFSPAEHQLLRTVMGIYRHPPGRIPSLKDMEQSDAVLVLGEDILNTAPLVALRVRQAVRGQAQTLANAANIPVWQDAAVQELAQQEKNPLLLLTATTTELDAIATLSAQRTPNDIARLGFAIAHALDASAPATADLDDRDTALAAQIAEILRQAKNPLIISGSSLLNNAIIEAAANIAQSLSIQQQAKCALYYCLAECNSLGSALLTDIADATGTLDNAVDLMASGDVERVVVLENDLYRRYSKERLDQALDKVKEIIVLDHTWSETAAKADWILPAASFAETEGTLINSEGRAQRFFAVYPLSADLQASWQWLAQAQDQPWQHIDDLTHACAATSALLAGIVEAAPDESFRTAGQKIPRMSHRYSGRTAINAHINVSEPKQTPDDMSALGFTMEGNANQLPPTMRPSTWSPGWNSNQSIHKFQQEVNGELVGGPSGIRLLDSLDSDPRWFDQIPAASSTKLAANTLLPIPLYHIFGSEELSNQADPIAVRWPQDYVAINPEDAEKLGLSAGDGVSFAAAGNNFCAAVQIQTALPGGTIGLPLGVGNISQATLDKPVNLQKAADWKPRPQRNDANVIASDSVAARGTKTDRGAIL